ncbi:2-oxoglutarate dehydrogenase E1 subunit family protein, partial [Rhodococcus phenolicus]|uniref:2-oxoglutarate dehydrogenase E1 subunit family protein n=1 Tax=Rhodococcus phenolicus TaxID=263849 RepID=UPI000AA3D826
MSSSSTSQFGQNQWLVDEMYQRFQDDPSSVDASWHEFLTDYSPETAVAGGANGTETATAPAPTATATAPAPKPAP